MKPAGTALITGASGGIGRELAAVFAENGHDLILVARREDRLQAAGHDLRMRFGIDVFTVSADLSSDEGIASAMQAGNRAGRGVDIFVNNAGRGTYRPFAQGAPGEAEALIRLNIIAPTVLLHHYLRGMIERGRGWVLNIVSTAAFKPGPMMAEYNAAKAYQLFLSEALANEVGSSGVTVTAVCPGATRTEFARNAGLEEQQLPRYKRIPSAREVAQFAYESLAQGRVVAVHGMANRAITMVLRFLPRGVVAAANRRSREVRW